MLAFQKAGATGIIFYDKWHDGLVPHVTKATTYRTERDLVGPTIRADRAAAGMSTDQKANRIRTVVEVIEPYLEGYKLIQ